ncbi:MAG: lipopolysaccharide biosynthesis protein [Kiritimatiellia bacterium]|jgi:O-antigen/teichoic acid export membrane protein
MVSLRKQVVAGVFWRFSEQFVAQLITFGVSVVLARLLEPSEFGTVALLTIFLVLSQCLVNSGFGSALIQKKDADDLDFNSVFYLSLAISVLMYVCLWLGAPWIALFYGQPVLVPVLRVAAIRLIFDGLSGVQNAVLARRMLFKRSFWITLSGTLVGGVTGIWMAYSGFGIWALVWSSLASGFVSTAVRWFLIGWRPGFRFSWQRLASLFKFGSRILGSSLLDTFFTQIYGLIIGKWYSPSDLAYFNRGEHLPQMAMNSVQGSIGSVVFPALSKMQDDRNRLKSSMRKVMQSSSFIVFPMMFGLAAVAEPLVVLLFSDKWLPAVPYMQLACIGYAFWPIHVANLQAIQAVGRSDIFLKLEVVKKIMMLSMLLLTFRHGVLAIAIGRAAVAPFALWVNSLPNRQLISYSQTEQLRDILPIGCLSVLTAMLAWGIVSLVEQPVLSMSLAVSSGVFVYCVLSFLLRKRAGFQVVHQFLCWFSNVATRHGLDGLARILHGVTGARC